MCSSKPCPRRHSPSSASLAASILAGEPVALATVTAGRPDQVGRHLVIWTVDTAGGLGGERLDDAVRDDARGLLATGRTATLHYGPDGQRRGEGLSVFVSCFAPAPRMLVFGAIDFAAAVARVGSFLGYRVTVCDARPVFATGKRFPEADEVVVDWPHRYLRAQVEAGALDGRTVICVLTHDPKFDVPVLADALRLPVAFVGAMGLATPTTIGWPGSPRPACPPTNWAGCRPRSVWTSAREPGGDGDLDRRRDHRQALGRRRAAVVRDRRCDPPASGTGARPARTATRADRRCAADRPRTRLRSPSLRRTLGSGRPSAACRSAA